MIKTKTMRSTKITSVTKNPKSRSSLSLFKDSVDNKIKVFDERGFIEELSGLQGPPGPQGNQGIQGEPGPVGPAGLNWQGSWVSGTSYVADDAVGYDGASYFCIQATSGTTAPSLDTTHWALLASQGARGPQGIQGVAGPQGPVGAFTKNQNVNPLIYIIEDTSASNYTQIDENLEFGSANCGTATLSFAYSGSDAFTTNKILYGNLYSTAINSNSLVFFTVRGDGSANTYNFTIKSSASYSGYFIYEILNHGPNITSGTIKFNWLII